LLQLLNQPVNLLLAQFVGIDIALQVAEVQIFLQIPLRPFL
tara:strand:- start:287 stop:409 length:123 start_codon:yes stop_codon:yes gene_type:complete